MATRRAVFDEYQRIRPREYEQTPIRVVDIDDASLAKLGQWPWPRSIVAALVQRLAHAGAGAIAFVVAFAEPDRTSPQSVLPIWAETGSVDDPRLRMTEIKLGLSPIPCNGSERNHHAPPDRSVHRAARRRHGRCLRSYRDATAATTRPHPK